jgi:hypothetical protein
MRKKQDRDFDVWCTQQSNLISAAPYMRRVLKQVEWNGFSADETPYTCPACGGEKDHFGHRKDCKLAAALKKARGEK